MIHFLNNESVQKFSDFLNEKLQPFLYESVTYGTKILLEQILIEAVKFIENETDYELGMCGQKIFNLKAKNAL